MADVLHLIPPHRVKRPSCGHVVQTMTVRAGNDGRVIGGLGPTLDLQAVHPGGHQVVQMIDHAHIPGVHDVGALFVLEHRKILPGPLLFHQRILIAAGLGAFAPVAVAASHIVAQQTASGIADAHGPVAEGLQFQLRGYPGPDGGDLLQTQLPGQHHAAGAQIIPGLGADVIGDGLLGADVPLAVGCVLPCQGERAQVRQDQGVHPRRIQLFQMGRQRLGLVPAGHGVHRGVYLYTVVVGELHRAGQLLVVKVSGKGSHPKGRTGQIHRIRAVQHGHLQLFPVPRRGQQFRLFPHGVRNRWAGIHRC